jgi:ferredoxin-like protein FixX
MAELTKEPMEIKAMLGTTSYNFDAHEYAHFMCMYGCPAGCFSLNEGVMQFQYEDCVECGTCDIMCTPGSVKWNNPRGTYGVKYKYG